MTTAAETIARAVEDLKDLQREENEMIRHEEADLILCRVLADMGAQAVVDEWKRVKKWYA